MTQTCILLRGERTTTVRWWPSRRFVASSLGTVLIAASALKIHGLLKGAPGSAALLGWRGFDVGVIVSELFLGVWLLSGVRAEAARCGAFITFALLGSVSLFKAFGGDSSCGCFGALAVK